MKVLYSVSRISDWVECAKLLQQQLGWKPVYWITLPENHDSVLNGFENIVAHLSHDLNRGIPAEGYVDNMNYCLSKTDMDSAQFYEPVAMDMMDRMDLGRVFSYQERQRLYHKLLAYWLTIIDDLKLNISIFNTPPHSIGEYIAYVSFKIRGLKIRIFRPTPVNNLHIVCDSVEKLPDNLFRAYNRRLEKLDCSLTDGTSKALIDLENKDLDYQPWYLKDVRDREGRWEKIKKKIECGFEDGDLTLDSFKVGEPLYKIKNKKNLLNENQIIKINYLKRKIKSHHDTKIRQVFNLPERPLHNALMNKWEYLVYRDWAYLYKLNLKKIYEKYVTDFDDTTKYVYFAMHYQPERTTCPDAGRFNNQYLAISIISNALPKGWILYVKEHPSQFNYHGMGELGRWDGYYEDIIKLSNVRFVSLNTPSSDLIKASNAVSTLTGAAGWEALIYGKPVICFGAAWYGHCRGAFLIENYDQAVDAIDKINNGCKPEKDEIRCYAGALEDVGKTIYTNPSLCKDVRLNEPLGTALANLLIKYESEII